ncbi:MAG: tripartite tricarboxylate transporter permease [Armatimonadota bacterium]|nr:tripartite tricarboxylate transporter permease [Armatimonadota bacterium]MDR7534943.1 tripartite tricarboxylate transporter permease [Armatimonadota bacterium]
MGPLLDGFAVALQPVNLAAAIAGVLVGQLIGVLPGIGPASTIAILLPVTFGLNATAAMIMFVGVYYGAMYGGTITSVLLNLPGESASVITTLDGYQMAQQGRGGAALGIAAFGSFIAGTLGVVALMLLAPGLARIALAFGPPEYATLLVLALSLVVYLGEKQRWKGAVSTLAGLWLATVGVDLISGQPRFTFGHLKLLSGVPFVPVAVGLFGLAEVLTAVHEGRTGRPVHADLRLRSVLPTAADWVASRWAILRGGLIGFFVGILPGAGATAASMIAYAAEKRVAQAPARFGRGAIEGVAAPESANNAAAVGALVPLLTLGVPGSATTAIMLGGLLVFGLRPGPLLFEQHPQFVWGVIASMYVSNLLLVLLNVLAIPAFVAVLRVPRAVLLPAVVAIAVVGVYSLENHVFEVWLALAFAAIGAGMRRFDYPAAPLVLALVLGRTLEESMRQSLLLAHGSLLIFVTRPLAAAFLAATAALLLSPALGRRRVRVGV